MSILGMGNSLLDVSAEVDQGVIDYAAVMEAATCPICLDTIFPADEVSISMCQPVEHFCHLGCWNAQTNAQMQNCPVCRQREVSESHILAISAALSDDDYMPEVWEVFNQMPPGAQVMLRLLQRSVITEDEFYQACDNPIVRMILRNIQ